MHFHHLMPFMKVFGNNWIRELMYYLTKTNTRTQQIESIFEKNGDRQRKLDFLQCRTILVLEKTNERLLTTKKAACILVIQFICFDWKDTKSDTEFRHVFFPIEPIESSNR